MKSEINELIIIAQQFVKLKWQRVGHIVRGKKFIFF